MNHRRLFAFLCFACMCIAGCSGASESANDERTGTDQEMITQHLVATDALTYGRLHNVLVKYLGTRITPHAYVDVTGDDINMLAGPNNGDTLNVSPVRRAVLASPYYDGKASSGIVMSGDIVLADMIKVDWTGSDTWGSTGNLIGSPGAFLVPSGTMLYVEAIDGSGQWMSAQKP